MSPRSSASARTGRRRRRRTRRRRARRAPRIGLAERVPDGVEVGVANGEPEEEETDRHAEKRDDGAEAPGGHRPSNLPVAPGGVRSDERVVVRLECRFRRRRPREAFTGDVPRSGAELRRRLASREQRLDARSVAPTGRAQEPGARSRRRRQRRAARPRTSRRPDGHTPSPRGRRRRSPRDGRGRRPPPLARSTGRARARRDEADRLGNTIAKRAVSDDHARNALGRLEELENPLLLGEPADEQDVRRFVGLCRPPREPRHRSARRAHLAPRARAQRPREPPRGTEPRGHAGRAGELPTGLSQRARRPCPRVGGRTACECSAPRARTGASARGRRRRRARRGVRRARTTRETPAAGAPSTVCASGSRRFRARTPARSDGTTRVRRPRRRRPRPCRCSTASRTKTPATSSGPRGYDVVRTTTLIRVAGGRPRRGVRPRASRTRRSSRRSS